MILKWPSMSLFKSHKTPVERSQDNSWEKAPFKLTSTHLVAASLVPMIGWTDRLGCCCSCNAAALLLL